MTWSEFYPIVGTCISNLSRTEIQIAQKYQQAFLLTNSEQLRIQKLYQNSLAINSIDVDNMLSCGFDPTDPLHVQTYFKKHQKSQYEQDYEVALAELNEYFPGTEVSHGSL